MEYANNKCWMKEDANGNEKVRLKLKAWGVTCTIGDTQLTKVWPIECDMNWNVLCNFPFKIG